MKYIIEGLDHIHGQKVIHQDVHSRNILYSNSNNKHPIVISDLGICKSLTESTDNNVIYVLFFILLQRFLKNKNILQLQIFIVLV